MTTRIYFSGALLAVLMGACRGPDEELAWDVGEVRTVHASARELPVSSGEEFHVFVPLGLQRFRLALAAQDLVAIGEGALVLDADATVSTQRHGIVSAMGRVVVGPNAELGAVYNYGAHALQLESGALVHGYVKTTAGVAGSRGARVGLGVMDHVDGQIVGFHWRVHAPVGPAGDRVSRAEDKGPLQLEPGAYTKVVIGAGSRAVIHGGQYYLRSLKVEQRGTLEVDNSRGPVYVWVEDELELKGSMLTYTGDPNVLFGYAGKATPSLATAFRGTLVAPRAALTVPATSVPHKGAFFARSITLERGATVQHVGFLLRHDDNRVSSAAVCDTCGVEAKKAVQECCSELGRSVSVSRLADRECGAACPTLGAADAARCSAECETSIAHQALAAQEDTDDCLKQASLVYARCQASMGYGPDTCLRMGYPGYGPVACR